MYFFILTAIMAVFVSVLIVIMNFMKQMKTVKTSTLTCGIFALDFKMVNSYLIESENGYIAIDAGLDPDKVRTELKKLSISQEEVHTVLLTHSDRDHCGGISAFREAAVFLPELEEQMINGTTKRKLFGRKSDNVLPVNYKLFKEGDNLTIDGLNVRAVQVPGHTPGSTAYIINDKFAFTGDMGIIDKGVMVVSSKIFNNDHAMASESVEIFNRKFKNLDMIATSHGGVLC